MSLTLALTPGYQFPTDGSVAITYDLLNLLARPTVDLAGAIGTLALADGSVTAAKLAVGAVAFAQLAWGETASTFNIGNVIPHDGTIPQQTEGQGILTVTITPVSSTSKLRVTAVIPVCSNVTCGIVAALFRDSTANAFAAGYVVVPGNGVMLCLTVAGMLLTSSTASTQIKLRVGPGTSGPAAYVNTTDGATSFLGGVHKTTLHVEEIFA